MHSCYKSIQYPRGLFQWLTALRMLYKQGMRLTQTQNDSCIYLEIHMQVLGLFFFLHVPLHPQYSPLVKRTGGLVPFTMTPSTWSAEVPPMVSPGRCYLLCRPKKHRCCPQAFRTRGRK